jgi:Kef-type K+ transport system membrane component KefB
VTDTTLSTLVMIMLVAVAAPILSDLADRWVRVPIVTIEILAGILIGPALGWAHMDEIIVFLSQLGLTALMFLAGLEIDIPRIRGRPLQRAVAGWGGSLALGLAAGVALIGLDGARSGLVVGLALTTTAFGILLPILRDSGELDTPFGTHVLAGAAVGELGPIVAVTVLLSTDRPARSVVVLAVFVVIVVLAAVLASTGRVPRLARLLDVTLTTSGQLAVRLVVLLLAVMVWIAAELGLDILLGAFAAGMVFRLFSAGASEREAELVEAKLQGLGFGFLVPVFFVVSGMQFDLRAVLDNPLILTLVPGFLLLFLLVRGVPSALLQRDMDRRDRVALACYLATELPLVVVITTIGVQTGRLRPSTAAALVTAALVSVLVYPLVAARVRGSEPAPGSSSATAQS